MADKGYIFKVLAHASFGKMKNVIKAVHKKSGKNSISIFFDMLWCAKRYGAGYYDYQIFAFYTLNKEQRKTFVTRLISKKFNTYMNDPEYDHLFNNKDEFNVLFKDYIGRGFLELEKATKDEVKDFVSTREYIFCKMKDLECGHGCERLKISDFADFEALYDYLTDKKFCTIEDNIVQHPALSKLYSNAVNSLRIITIIDDNNVPHCVYLVQKMGCGGSIIDNNCLFSPVDPETGVIKYPAHSGDTTKGIVYNEHPDTKIHIQGYQLPFIKEAVDMCLKAAMVVPQVRYVGWDVALTENGPVIIEGNNYCAHDFWQLPPHTPNKIGMLPTITKLVPSFRY